MGAALRSACRAELLPASNRSSSPRTLSDTACRDPGLRLVVGGVAVRGHAPIAVPAPLFDQAEQLAIVIGRKEQGFRPDPTSRLGRLLRFLFGLRGPNPLADPKLELLRRLAQGSGRGQRRVVAAVNAALAAGIAQSKIDFLLAR